MNTPAPRDEYTPLENLLAIFADAKGVEKRIHDLRAAAAGAREAEAKANAARARLGEAEAASRAEIAAEMERLVQRRASVEQQENSLKTRVDHVRERELRCDRREGLTGGGEYDIPLGPSSLTRSRPTRGPRLVGGFGKSTLTRVVDDTTDPI